MEAGDGERVGWKLLSPPEGFIGKSQICTKVERRRLRMRLFVFILGHPGLLREHSRFRRCSLAGGSGVPLDQVSAVPGWSMDKKGSRVEEESFGRVLGSSDSPVTPPHHRGQAACVICGQGLGRPVGET